MFLFVEAVSGWRYDGVYALARKGKVFCVAEILYLLKVSMLTTYLYIYKKKSPPVFNLANS